jgi:hypothetical protein
MVPIGTPYVTWLPTGGPNGTLVVSAYSSDELLLNTQNGAANTWTRMPSNVAGGYSRTPAAPPPSSGASPFNRSAGNSQRWTLTAAGGGSYKLVNVNSGLPLGAPTKIDSEAYLHKYSQAA